VARLDGNLRPKQQAAVLALLNTRSIEEAATAAVVPVRTLYRWLQDPDFDAAYRDAKRASYGQGVARLHQMCSAAASTLGKVMVDAKTPPATKVRAADSILNQTAKAIQIEDIEARLAELERGAREAKKG
jgi:hypothetical protein